MQVVGLNGNDYKINLSQYLQKRPGSANQQKVRELLKELFPMTPILEEVTLPGCSTTLYADFLIPSHSLMVEIHGEQHYQFNGFMHKSKKDFIKGKGRDSEKAEWCEVNNIRLVVLDHKDNEDVWREAIQGI